MATDGVAHLYISLDHMDPPVWRRLTVPTTLFVDQLHAAIQVAMGWGLSHLYEFRLGPLNWTEAGPDGGFDDEEAQDATETRVSEMLVQVGRKRFKYVYDFGDNWKHTLKFERVAPAQPGSFDLALLEAVGRCPPEDAGGPPGYWYIQEAYADPKHADHQEAISWLGEAFDPARADEAALREEVRRLAEEWQPKPKKAPKSKVPRPRRRPPTP